MMCEVLEIRWIEFRAGIWSFVIQLDERYGRADATRCIRKRSNRLCVQAEMKSFGCNVSTGLALISSESSMSSKFSGRCILMILGADRSYKSDFKQT